MCRKTQKSPAFQAGVELFQGYFAWCSSIGSHMSDKTQIQRRFFVVIGHETSPFHCIIENNISVPSGLVDS
jgi:hypothetical protein